jgi:hypothetical protein
MVNPFIVLVDRHGPQYVGKKVGVTHSTISIYRSALSGEGKCGITKSGKPRATSVPAEWVVALCGISEFQPYQFRPDVFLPNWRI